MPSRSAERALFIGWCAILLVAAELVARALVPLEQVPRWRGFHIPDSLAAYRLAPNLDGGIYFYGRVPIRTNSLGLRDRDYGPRAAGVARVLMIGDSQTLGLVPEPATLARQLERTLARDGRRWEIINAGVLGYGTEQELIRLRGLLPVYKPDLVVLTVFANDIYDNHYRPRDRWVVGDDGYLHSRIETPHPLPPPRRGWMGAYDWLARHVDLFALGSRALSRVVHRGPTRPAALPDYAELLARDWSAGEARDWARTDSLIGEVATAARAGGARIAVVDGGSRAALGWATWPESTDTRRYDLDREARALDGVAERIGAPCVHVMPAFRAERSPLSLYFPNDDHWTARGDAVVAALLAPTVRAQCDRAASVAR
ncbi:MAG: hypothetical protein HYR74_05480 [Candidatus Eisenbacteria bacterium]|nr:hypothetical protein [Candidatus Eisenbacteria bacterium]